MDVIDGITFRRLETENRIPGFAEPQDPDLDLVDWARDQRQVLESKLDEYGSPFIGSRHLLGSRHL